MISRTKTSGRAPRPFPPIRAGLLLALGALLVAGRSARALSLNPDAGVAPKVVTPNADAINDVVCFQMDNPALTELRGTVSDAAGAEVAELRPATAACAPPHDVYDLMWDGRDRAGRTAPAGPYIYRIEGEGVMFTGVVVVAK